MSSKFSSPFMAKSPLNIGGGLGKLVKTFAHAAKQYGKKAMGKTKKKPVVKSDRRAGDEWRKTATPEQVVEMSKRAGVNVPSDILKYPAKMRQTVIDNYNKTLKK